MGSIREVDRVLDQTLMAEFLRIQLIVHQDVAKSLLVLREDLQASSAALISDVTQVVDLSLANPRSAPLRASLWKFQRTTSLKFNLPLVKLEVAHEDIEAFMSNRFQELSLENESQELIGELS